MRKFEYREAYEPPAAHASAKRGIDFSMSDENSETLGMPSARKNRPVYTRVANKVPEAVDARDGFDINERQGDGQADLDLSVMLRALQIQFPNESLSEIRERMWDQRDRMTKETIEKMPALEDIGPQNGVPVLTVPPLAMLKPLFPMGSSDMIPALRGLSSWEPSENSLDTAMPEVSSVLGKRFASHTDEEAESERAIVIHQYENQGNVQKKGRVKTSLSDVEGRRPMEGIEFMEAISPGAADKLTGTQAAPRQEQ
jgi:hypothetical protein